jgi:hypothetical protein
MVSRMSKTFSAMLDLADSSDISLGGVMRESISAIFYSALCVFLSF